MTGGFRAFWLLINIYHIMRVCVCVCVYVYAYMYIFYTHLRTYIKYTYTCMYINIHTYIYVYIYIYMYICMCVCVCVCVSLCVCEIFVPINVRMVARTYVCMYICTHENPRASKLEAFASYTTAELSFSCVLVFACLCVSRQWFTPL